MDLGKKKKKSVNLQAEIKGISVLLENFYAYGLQFKLIEILVMLSLRVGKAKASEAQAAGDRIVIQCFFQEPPVQCQTVAASSAANKRLMALLAPTSSKPAVSSSLPRIVTRCDVRLLKLWETNKAKPLRESMSPKYISLQSLGLKMLFSV